MDIFEPVNIGDIDGLEEPETLEDNHKETRRASSDESDYIDNIKHRRLCWMRFITTILVIALGLCGLAYGLYIENLKSLMTAKGTVMSVTWINNDTDCHRPIVDYNFTYSSDSYRGIYTVGCVDREEIDTLYWPGSSVRVYWKPGTPEKNSIIRSKLADESLETALLISMLFAILACSGWLCGICIGMVE